MSKQTITNGHLYGLVQHQLVEHHGYLVQQDALAAFLKLSHQARLDGLNISMCSAYRSFERQLAIFNAKASGQRPLLDRYEQLVTAAELKPDALLNTILAWSALPGASRHHWGTDIDVYDADQIQGSQLQLVVSEYQDAGPCAHLAQWLKLNCQQFGFFMPYQEGQSGVSREPWHISFAPIANNYLNLFNVDELHLQLINSDIMLKQSILDHLPQLVEEYVYRIAVNE